MFVGHFALGFAAKRVAPRVSLGVLFLAAQFADVLWPVLVAAGIESVRIAPGITAFTPLDFVSYPYSHSLVALAVSGAALGVVCQIAIGGRTTFVVIAALVLSHWLLDFATHRPDMPLYPGSATYGFGLWNSVAATVIVELAMFAAGVWIYAVSTRARDRVGRWSFIALVTFLVIAYAGNVMGGPPPSVGAIYWSAIAGAAVILVWSWWTDSHRDVVPTRG
jgi:membrane-bound metal-dependent hydrolase YbcI (DUF457 family)